jgi:choline dehydrogenase-like flavoprotein
MGRADGARGQHAVVDPALRARHQRLRVIDASGTPCITPGNSNSPTPMIAKRESAMILAGHR